MAGNMMGQQLDFFEDTPANEDKTDEIRARLKEVIGDNPDFKIIERVPITKKGITLPYKLAEKVGDEETVVFLDTETTGLNQSNETIIELGLVKASFSPSKSRLTSIDAIFSEYEDPQKPIPPEVVKLTGITDQDVKGQKINRSKVKDLLDGTTLVIAHNAGFDRPFFEKRFTTFNDLRWACSLKGIDWMDLGFPSHRQEELLHAIGYFYDAHRASTDCLALAWFMHKRPDAFRNLLENAEKKSVIVHAFGAPFDAKDTLKANGYRWDDGTSGNSKHWWREVPESDLDNEKAFLDDLYSSGSDLASYSVKTAENRFRQE